MFSHVFFHRRVLHFKDSLIRQILAKIMKIYVDFLGRLIREIYGMYIEILEHFGIGALEHIGNLV